MTALDYMLSSAPALDLHSVVNCVAQFTTVFLIGLLRGDNLTVQSIECQYLCLEGGINTPFLFLFKRRE